MKLPTQEITLELIPVEAEEKVWLKASGAFTPDDILKQIQVMYPDWIIDVHGVVFERNADNVYPVVTFTRRRNALPKYI